VISVVSVDYSTSRVESLRGLGTIPQFVADDGRPIRSVNEYFRSQARRWSINTIKTYAEHVAAFLNWLENLEADLNECDDHTVAIYAEALCSSRVRPLGLSWNTIDRRICVVAALLKWCAKNGYVRIDPEAFDMSRQVVRGTFQRAGHPSRPIKKPTRWITLKRALNLISRMEEGQGSAHAVRNGLIARLMLEAGLRVSEVIQFPLKKLPDIDDSHDFAITTILGKGRKERLVPIPMRLLRDLHGYKVNERQAIFESARSRRRAPADTLFLTQRGSAPTRGWIEKIFREASEMDGQRITPHMLRHTFGTYHYHLHKDLPLLRNIMGHSQQETTESYYVHTAVLSGYSAEFANLISELDSFSD
jgi:integrase/recombinase XerD